MKNLIKDLSKTESISDILEKNHKFLELFVTNKSKGSCLLEFKAKKQSVEIMTPTQVWECDMRDIEFPKKVQIAIHCIQQLQEVTVSRYRLSSD